MYRLNLSWPTWQFFNIGISIFTRLIRWMRKRFLSRVSTLKNVSSDKTSNCCACAEGWLVPLSRLTPFLIWRSNNNNNNNNSFINLLKKAFQLNLQIKYLKLSFPKICCLILTLDTSKLVINWNSSGRLFHSLWPLKVNARWPAAVLQSGILDHFSTLMRMLQATVGGCGIKTCALNSVHEKFDPINICRIWLIQTSISPCA